PGWTKHEPPSHHREHGRARAGHPEARSGFPGQGRPRHFAARPERRDSEPPAADERSLPDRGADEGAARVPPAAAPTYHHRIHADRRRERRPRARPGARTPLVATPRQN